MSRAYNFCEGPATLPESVLRQARDEMLDWRGTGMSVMEMSHRSDEFVQIAETAEKDLRELAGVSDDYAVLFMQGGASSQFSTIPLNLLGEKGSADYVNTGIWSKKDIAEASRYGKVNVVASSEDSGFTTIPDQSSWQTSADAAYLHYTPNETIGGLEFGFIPDSPGAPLVADAAIHGGRASRLDDGTATARCEPRRAGGAGRVRDHVETNIFSLEVHREPRSVACHVDSGQIGRRVL